MKIINVRVDGNIKIVDIFDTCTQTSETVGSSLKIPTGNYKDIIFKFDFVCPLADDLHLLAMFKASFLENPIEVEITDIEAEGEIYQTSCFIPGEVLQEIGTVELGIYGYNLNEDETLKKRISLEPIVSSVVKGSYDENAINNIVLPTPTVFEVYFDKVNKANAQMQANLKQYENDINELFDNANENLKKIKHFNSVAEMKACTTLIETYVVMTLGYYEANDGGGATYRIREKIDTDEEDNGSIHFLQNNLVAELVVENVVNLKQFGVKNDGVTDCTTQVKNAISFGKSLIGCGGTVVISSAIDIKNATNKIDIDFKDTLFLVNNTSNTIDYVFKILSNDTNRVRGSIRNLYINSNGKSLIGLYVLDTQQFELKHIDIKGSINQEYRIDRTGVTGNATVLASDMRFTNGYEINLENTKESNAMDISSPDSHYTDIVTLGYKNHIVNNAMNFYTRVHSWNYKSDTINDSTMFLNSAQMVADNCYADTLQTMFNCYNSGSIDVINPIYFLNPDFYLDTHNDPTPIIVSDNFITNYGRIRITGGRFQSITNKKDLPFINYTDRSSNFRLNLLRLVDTHIGTFTCSRYFLEYTNTNLDISVNSDIATTISSYLSKLVTMHGYSMLNIGMSVNGLKTTGQYVTVATITDEDFVVQNTDSFYAFVRPNSSTISYPVLCKLTSNKEIQINVSPNVDLGSTGFNLRINTFNLLNPTNTLVE